jgi:hypothetical protein
MNETTIRPPRQRRRWSNHDRHLGRFITYARDEHGKPFGIVLDSGEGEHPGCHLRLRGFGHTVLIELPAVIKPWRQWVSTEQYEWSKGSRGYWDEHGREFGFQLSDDGFLQVFLGPQTHDSTTTKSWSCFLPWTQWRHVRFSLYGLAGEHVWSQLDADRKRGSGFDEQRDAEQACPKVRFTVRDVDDEVITATTHISEREWHFGTKWCKWLSIFRRPMIRRSLAIEFSEEVGPDKGSWKGGLVGTSIEMLPGELHESAFRRYCDQEHRSKYRSYRVTFLPAKAPA